MGVPAGVRPTQDQASQNTSLSGEGPYKVLFLAELLATDGCWGEEGKSVFFKDTVLGRLPVL